jgi:choloylglycine hydrolase
MRIALFAVFLSLFSWISAVTADAPACTGMRVVAKDGAVVWARSLEFGSDIESVLMVAPRGMLWVSGAPDKSPGLHWKAKHAFVGPTAWGLPLPIEGMNEKGLYAGGFWMTEGETEFPDVRPADYPHTVAQMHFVPWVLTNFTTVDEVKAALPGITIAGVRVEALRTVPLAH